MLAQTRHRVPSLSEMFATYRRGMIQTFQIDPDYGKTIRGRYGLEVDIPAFSLVDERGEPATGPVTVEMIELPTTRAMMRADRPTTSGDQLLETGGAFYLSARREGRNLQPRRPVEARLPMRSNAQTRSLMEAWDGITDRETGSFTWRGSSANNIREATAEFYRLSMRRFRWFNCDYNYRRAFPEATFQQLTVRPECPVQPEPASTRLFLQFDRINALAAMRPDRRGGYTFQVPEQQPFTLHGITAYEGLYFYGRHRQAQWEPHPLELPMQEVSREELSELLGPA